MSALPPKADIPQRRLDVRFVPIADSPDTYLKWLRIDIDGEHLVGARQMTAEDFCCWMSRLGLSKAQAAAALGCSTATIARYRRGEGLSGQTERACRDVEREVAMSDG